jgi:nitric oxide reductase subunit B
VAPDWTADWLHREATWLLNRWAEQAGCKTYEQADAETQAMLRQRLKKEIRSNTYQPETGDLVLSPLRAEAIKAVGAHYAALFGDDTKLKDLRKAHAIPANTIKTTERQQLMNSFFFWAAWA